MTECITQYKRALKRNLRCSGSTRERLLAKFNSSLTTFLEETPAPRKDEIYAAFGPPKELADLLMAEVTPKEATRYRKKSNIIRFAAGILVAIFFAGAVYIYFMKEIPVKYDDKIVIDPKESGEPGVIIEDEVIIVD